MRSAFLLLTVIPSEDRESLSESASPRPQQGFILIAVLWVSMLLSIFALNFSTSARLHGFQALNLQKRFEQSKLLESAIALGYHEYIKYSDNRALVDKKDEIEGISEQALQLWYPRHEPYNATIDGQSLAVHLVNANGKADINGVDFQFLQEVLAACGVEIGTRRTALANSILDWIDKDDMRRAEGAEKAYYLNLPDPYLPKNNKLESTEELLLIKGITPEVYYGNDQKPGLQDFFSVYGQSNKLDINCIDPVAFTLIDGFPADVTQQVIDRRKEKPITDINELSQIVPQRYYSEFKKYFHVTQTKHLTVEAMKVLQSGARGRSQQKTFNIGG